MRKKTRSSTIPPIRFTVPSFVMIVALAAAGVAAGVAAAAPQDTSAGPGTDLATAPAAHATVAASGVEVGPATASTDRGYVGSRACRRCHLKQYKTWQEKPHASVFDLLQPGARVEAKEAAGLDPNADYSADPKCLECHSVGHGEPTGFESLKSTKELASVGCESCHGPGSEYGEGSAMGPTNKNHSFESVIAKGLVYPVGEATCRRCHNERSPFNAQLDAKYAFEYSRDIVEGATHEHRPLKYDHGPLPAGVLFQK